MQLGKKQIPASEGTGTPLHPCSSRLNNLEIEQKVSNPKLGGTNIRQNVGSVKDRPPPSHLNVHKQLLQQDTPPIAKEDEGHTITRYLTALCAAWILLKYARTLPRNANTTRNKWALTILVFASNIHIVDAATIQNISHMILQNAAQIKILDCFTAYQQRQHLGGYDSEEEAEISPHGTSQGTSEHIRGDAIMPTDNHLKVSIVNGSQGAAQYTRWSDLLDLATQKESDVMVISEPGKKATEQALTWGTHHISPQDSATHKKRTQLGKTNREHMKYLVYAAHGDKGDGEGGVVILLHEKWRHRVSKVKRHARGRWLQLTLMTPVGAVTIIGYYGRPNPKATPQAVSDWQDIQTKVHKCHAKGHTVILAGDFNLSYNWLSHRQQLSHSPLQHTMLNAALKSSGLTDAYTHRHGKATRYHTWEERKEGVNPVWTSPDHILISSTAAYKVTAAQVDDAPLSMGMDHAIVTAAVHITSNPRIKQSQHTKLTCKDEDKDRYNELVLQHLQTHQKPQNTEEALVNLHTAIVNAVTTIKPKHVHRTKGKYGTRLQADIRTLGKILRCLKRETNIPQELARQPVYTSIIQPNAKRVGTKLRELQQRINKKAEKRTTIRARMYKYNRSEHFRTRNYGAFLNSALSRFNNFQGIEGFLTTTVDGEPAVDMDPERTKQIASNRVQQQHFSPSIPTPQYYKTRTQEDWDAMDPWFKKMFHTTHTPAPKAIYAHIMDPVNLVELTRRIKHLRKGKAGGRSQVTADLLQQLDTETVKEWVLPFVNNCLEQDDIPPTGKLFAVWAIEKIPGAGSIITSTGKLNIRPITLLEPIFKLIESIIHTRLSRAMTKAGALNPNHYGFTQGKGADDLMLEESMVFEDAHQHHKEFHGSNNDCTAAYDNITPWTSETIYQYHGLPQRLIAFMLNIDKHQHGRILTAHGAGEDFEKECSLGQGSILAPLKWKLFLDPLLKELDRTGDPYIMGTGENRVEIYAAAFADDLTVIAPTHKDYTLRMELTNKYLSFFGIELNASKTTYTYANTDRHYEPIQIWNKHTGETAPSAVAAPTTALRYLGGWLSPSLRSRKGKRMLLAGIHGILNVLQYKKLDWREYRYVIQSVVASKALYYLNVAPFTDAELNAIDRRIAGQFKKTLKLARSTSSHICYLPEAERGFALPSIKQRRDALLIKQAYRCLNDPGHLGKIFRTRLLDLKAVTGHTQNPLNTPASYKQLYNKYWLARVAHILQDNGHKISTQLDMATPQPRATDYPLHEVLDTTTYNSLLPNLIQHKLTWVSDVADATGKRVKRMQRKSAHGTKRYRQDNAEWYETLTSKLTLPNSSSLRKQVSPNMDPIFHTTTHKTGSIVFLPKEHNNGEYAPATEGYFFKVTGHSTDGDHRPTCTLQWLTPMATQTKYTTSHISIRFRAVTQHTPILWANPANPPEEEAEVDLLSVKFITQRVATKYSPQGPQGRKHVKADSQKWFPTVYLVTQNHSISTVGQTIVGPTPITDITAHQQWMIGCQTRSSTGEVHMDTDTKPHAVCPTCQYTDTDTKCALQLRCGGWYHQRCNPTPRSTVCTACLPSDATAQLNSIAPLSPVELAHLNDAKGLIYSSTDGSVKGVATHNTSSTWGLCIRVIRASGKAIHIKRRGKVLITAGEESSYRVEVEGLIQLYTLMPAHIHTRHACDNEAAVKAHLTSRAHAGLGARRWAAVEYRVTLDRLHQAISSRNGRPITVVHTHSHLENVSTPDTDLHTRRQLLAIADFQADKAHTLPAVQCGTSMRELFTVHGPHGPLEKNVGHGTLKTLTARRTNALENLPMEGALLRANPDRHNTASKSSLPDHLLIFRTKVILNRLPTRQERHRRGDTHADGTHIEATCPNCAHPIEDHLHAIADCPHLLHHAAQLAFDINNTIRTTSSTLFKKATRDAAWLQQQLQTMHDHTFVLKAGWRTTYTDKHGRTTVTSTGPDRVGSHKGRDTLHPTLFRSRIT